MKPILVHVHIYYPEMWEELKGYLKNLASYPYDLYVTFVENHHSVIEDIKSFKPEAKIEIVENRGFDVGPFIHVLNQVNLDDYSYLIKLHTKRDMPVGVVIGKYDVSKGKWRKYLLSFLEKENIEKCITAFEKDEKLGMCGNFRLILNKGRSDNEAFELSIKYLNELNLEFKQMCYVAGTMFIARADLFNKIKELGSVLESFEVSCRKNKTAKAHIFERLFGLVVCGQNYEIKDAFTPNKKQFLLKKFLPVGLFLYRKKEKKNGEIIIKVCKIPFPLSAPFLKGFKPKFFRFMSNVFCDNKK